MYQKVYTLAKEGNEIKIRVGGKDRKKEKQAYAMGEYEK